jgi:hypothetical protein
MLSDSATELVGIATFILVAGLIFYVFDRPRGGARAVRGAPRQEAKSAGVAPGRQWAGESREIFSESASIERAESRFRAMARRKLDPLLEEIVRTAKADGHRAAYEVRTDNDRTFYRLELEPVGSSSGHAAPSITLVRGVRDDVELMVGAAATGDAEGVDVRREVAWSQVERELRQFAENALEGA